MTRKNRSDVVAAARVLFAEQGFHGTSMRDLGRELGLMGSSLYSHVVSKDELLVDVVREASSRFQVLADDVRQMPGTAAERLAHLIHGRNKMLTEDPSGTHLSERIRFLPDSERKSREMLTCTSRRFGRSYNRAVPVAFSPIDVAGRKPGLIALEWNHPMV